MDKIIDYDRNMLIKLIDDTMPHFEQQYKLIKDLEDFCNKYNELIDKKAKKNNHSPIILFLTFVLLIPLIYYIVKIYKQTPLDLYNLFKISLLLFYVFLVSLVPIIHFSSNHSAKKMCSKYKEKINHQILLINNLREKNDALQIIPFRYQTPVAMQEIIQYLVNYRTTNWTDAVNIPEDTIHKNYMIYLQSKQLATLNQQLDTLNGIRKNTQASSLDVVKFIVGVVK